MRRLAVVLLLAVLVEVVVELAVGVPGRVPLVPAGRLRVGGQVLVQVLAHQRGAVAGVVQRQREGLLLVAVLVEGEVPAVGAGVGEDPVVVRVLTGEDGRAGRAAQRVHHVVPGHRRPGPLQGLQVRHVADQVPGQVVGEHEDEVRPRAGRGPRASGGRPGRCSTATAARAMTRRPITALVSFPVLGADGSARTQECY